jgi:hypothetical protein
VEWPAFVKHEGMPARPAWVRLADRPVSWRVQEVLSEETGDDPMTTGAIRQRYRLRVYGQLPHSEKTGRFELVATTYVGKPYWWIRPESEDDRQEARDQAAR